MRAISKWSHYFELGQKYLRLCNCNVGVFSLRERCRKTRSGIVRFHLSLLAPQSCKMCLVKDHVPGNNIGYCNRLRIYRLQMVTLIITVFLSTVQLFM